MIVRDDDGCRAAQQSPVVNLHGINTDVVLRAEPEEFKGADGLGVIETHEPQMLAIAVEFGLAEVGGLEEMEDVGGSLDVEVLIEGEADWHSVKVLEVRLLFVFSLQS